MGISIYNIKKWYRMMTGKSALHVNQDIGKSFSVSEIKGYYNNLTEKVLIQPELLNTTLLPTVKTESGEDIYFPVAVFQYGLGAYDLFLQTGEERYKEKFSQSCKWAIENQEASGAWSNFFFIYQDHPYGAMCQGEGVSLLLRGYIESGDEVYLSAARRALDFMLMPVENGGCTEYSNNQVVFKEYTHLPTVLNGWIFSLFGLYDYMLFSRDNGKYKSLFDASINSLIQCMPDFSVPYWSMYDLDGKIASPFYHNLHIAQMEALYQMTGDLIFNKYEKKWKKNQSSLLNKGYAFIKKAIQKIAE